MGSGAPSSPYTNPNLLAPSNPNPLLRRTSSGSTGSYEIRIEPPSRPSSSTNNREDDANGTYLSPNHQPAPLPVVPRGSSRFGYNGPPTQPNSPVVLPGPIPSNFVAQTFTDRNGVSTPLWQANSLPDTTPPVIPGVTTSTGSQKYGNPLHKDKDEDGPPVFPRSPKSPNRRLSGTPAPGTWGSGGWTGSGGGGLTPASSMRDLPGVGGGNRTSVFGGVMNSPAQPAMSMPEPTVPFIPPPPEEIEDDNGFDQTTMQNTAMNATIGKKTGGGKKKKKR
ncbi:hypothetical protein CPB84DRAFT_309011 [Gymnopilus junonius]|uniref:Uncharacterized protein n=1 Tax=Gymnopilus junonius TaxID=109634 RepID=A0A9P5TRU1_GYMJU|nr:hypothetical protein CPB84DRAFT_309011 [Gymnopilus junonius]